MSSLKDYFFGDGKALRRTAMFFIPLIVLAYIAHYYGLFGKDEQEVARKKVEQIRAETFRRNIKANVSKMAVKYGAVEDWEKDVAQDGEAKDSEAFGRRLEKVWIAGKPIVFVGHVDSIQGDGDTDRTVYIDKPIDPLNKKVPVAGVALSLKCPAGTINPFLEKHPTVVSPYGRVAVVAEIARVEKKEKKSGKDDMDIYVGHGRCVDIIDTGSLKANAG